jgi:thiamine-monophosphate kinase
VFGEDGAMTAARSAVEQTLADVGEFGLIDLVRTSADAPHVLIGPGDDAALVRASPQGMLASIDVAVEGRHFRRDWSSARDVGHKVAAANLADIAAMGGTARSLLVGFSAPGDLPVPWAMELIEGLVIEAASVGAVVVGGDVTAADSIVVSVSVLGEPGEQVVRRNGARPGDVVAVAGRLGWAGAGFAVLTRGLPLSARGRGRTPTTTASVPGRPSSRGRRSPCDGRRQRRPARRPRARRPCQRRAPRPAQRRRRGSGTAAGGGCCPGREPLGFVLTGGDDHALAACFIPDAVPDGWLQIGVAHEPDDAAAVTVDGEEWPGAPGHSHFG